MKIIFHVESQKDLDQAQICGVPEILLGHSQLSPLGKLSTSEIQDLARSARDQNIKCVLLWDSLMRDVELKESVNVIQEIDLNLFQSIRVLDPGALEWVIQHAPGVNVQLIMRTGAHNLEAISNWFLKGEARVERLILSSELPKTKLQEYIQYFKNTPQAPEIEVLGLGAIQLFHSPRALLDEENNRVQAVASCDENTHRGFRVVQTQHGTLLFHAKDYCLLDRVSELQEMGMAALTIDLRQSDSLHLNAIAEITKTGSEELYNAFVLSYSQKVTRCFYNANGTDVLFKKLKNTTTQRVDQAYVGEVIESVKDRHTILKVVTSPGSLKIGTKLNLVTPVGKSVEYTIHQIQDLDREPIQEVAVGDYLLFPYIRSATPTTAVYLSE